MRVVFDTNVVVAGSATRSLKSTYRSTTALENPACRDPEDDWGLATAIAGEAEVIVTSDADLLDLLPFRRIAILSPRGFLERLQRTG